MNLSFKLATLADIDRILELMPLYYADDHLRFDRPKAERAVRELISSNSLGKIWLVLSENSGDTVGQGTTANSRPTGASSETLIGYGVVTYGFSLECGGREAFVDELFVRKKFRGQGIGGLVIEHIARECEREGVHAIRLEVTRSNDGASKLYRRLGFEDLGRSLLIRWIHPAARSVGQ